VFCRGCGAAAECLEGTRRSLVPPRRPPTSKKDIPFGVAGISLGLGCSSWMGAGDFMSVSSVSTEALVGKVQALSIGSAGVVFASCLIGTATGAGRGTLEAFSVKSGPRLMPRSPTKSASLPQALAVMARRGAVVDLSRLLCPPVLPKRKRCFFAPRSRTNEPRTSAFETAAAARISAEARRERNCWS